LSEDRNFALRFVRGQGPAATSRWPVTTTHGSAVLEDVRPVDVGGLATPRAVGVVDGVGEREGVEVKGRVLGNEETAAAPLPVVRAGAAGGGVGFVGASAQGAGAPGGRVQAAAIAVAAGARCVKAIVSARTVRALAADSRVVVYAGPGQVGRARGDVQPTAE